MKITAMKIDSIHISVFETKSHSPPFQLVDETRGAHHRWLRQSLGVAQDHLHVLHVRTDEGLEGVCTVGDARYRTMRLEDLEQLRALALGEDPFDRERLNWKCHAATRGMFTRQGWYGAFDNCLWDIAGQAAGLPVSALLGRARACCPCYLNIGGGRGPDADRIAVEDAQRAVEAGFPAVKDHFRDSAMANVARFAAVREAVGPDIDILHDAAMAGYTFDEALYVGRALEEQRFAWFEEPMPDVCQAELKRLCDALDVPILAPETMMNDVDLSAQWLISGATDHLRANARHGTTSTLKLAHLTELHGANVELNGPGGLFGLVHAHLVCALRNTSYYEYFPGGTRDEAGAEIGLLNPPLPRDGYIAPPDAPGWGAEWDWTYFRQVRVAVL